MLLLVGIALAIIAPLLVLLIRAAISREREYLADASGAYIVRDPEGLASALKLGAYTGKLRMANGATATCSSPIRRARTARSCQRTCSPPTRRLSSG